MAAGVEAAGVAAEAEAAGVAEEAEEAEGSPSYSEARSGWKPRSRPRSLQRIRPPACTPSPRAPRATPGQAGRQAQRVQPVPGAL